jgi:hypothetical protein
MVALPATDALVHKEEHLLQGMLVAILQQRHEL